MSLTSFKLPDRAARDLGFKDVLDRLRAACASPFGLEAIDDDVFPTSREVLDARLGAGLEAKALHALGAVPGFGALIDLRPLFEFIEREAVLGANDILDVARTLEAISRIGALLESRQETAPALAARAETFSEQGAFVARLLRTFDDEANLTDAASPELKNLRDRVRALRKEAGNKLEGLVRTFDEEEILRDRNFTMRNDRYCLPVVSGFQHRVEGIVHDASQTGQTVFIEPRAILEVGNRIMIAQAEVREEETRILRELTQDIRAIKGEVVHDLVVVAHLEADFARGKLAYDIDGQRPAFGDHLELVEARHPQLAWRAADAQREKRKPESVVPNDLILAGKQALVISGPNAGGKTVALKTAGLVSVFVRAGLLPPIAATSTVPLFRVVVATVGDAQDLDRGLSSFTGHLEALKEIEADIEGLEVGEALVLLDEIAAGTDPTQGAALAQAYLEDLADKGAHVVATTHYERLKLLGLEDARFENASVGSDPKTGQPTYRVHLGQVGTSDAFEAAKRLGIGDDVLARATALLRPDEAGVQEMLRGLEKQAETLRAAQGEAEAKVRKLEEERTRLRKRLEDVDEESRRLRREGAGAFAKEIADARKQVADAIERVQAGADARELNEISHDLKAAEAEASKAAEAPKEVDDDLAVDVNVGDRVRVASLGNTEVEVLEIGGDEVQVARGPIKMRVPLADLRQGKARPTPKKKRTTKTVTSTNEPRTSTNTLDIRGERLSDALELLEAFLDDLMRKGRTASWVLHGHGTGALKKGVREALAQSRYVKRHSAADPDDGGDACTKIELADGGMK